jgi:lysozyme family protein
MADFDKAFVITLDREGGAVLHKVEHDAGGWTFCGIAENIHPDWEGWLIIREFGEFDPRLMPLVRVFFKEKYWDMINGDQIYSQSIAESIYDFGVNAGIRTSAKLAQKLAGVISDGAIGPKSLAALEGLDEELFSAQFALLKIARYVKIVDRKPTQLKFLKGWINRTLKAL